MNRKMSDCLDVYHDMYKEEIERKNKAENIRKKLVEELLTEDMVEIMFTAYISKQKDSDIIQLGNDYFGE